MKDLVEPKKSSRRIIKKVKPVKKNINKELTDEQKRKLLLAGLPGLWEYYCEVSGNNSFDNGEKQRGGTMRITLRFDGLLGPIGKITGTRIWSKKQYGKKKIMNQPLSWETDHQISLSDDNKLIFTYMIFGNKKEGGRTSDVYSIDEKKGFNLTSPGTFEHTTSKGKNIVGFVHLRKMKNEIDFQWRPI